MATRQTKAMTWFVLAWLVLAITASCVQAQAPTTGFAEAEEPSFFQQLLHRIFTFDSRGLMELLEKPQFQLAAFIALNIIVFTETGLLIGFFLPGDSLLVTAGVICYGANWSLPLLLVTLCISAIVGDSVGYTIGLRTGPKIFNREKSWLFHKDHLLKAQEFYEKHGGKTIILARFMPIIRTFAPVVAGVGKMEYRKFLFFNVIGGVGWVISMVMLGYFLKDLINPLFQSVLGNPNFDVKDHIEKVVVLVVLVSISPGIYVWLRAKMKKKPDPAPVLAEAGK